MRPVLLASFDVTAPRDPDTGEPLGPKAQPRIQARAMGDGRIRTWTPARAEAWKRAVGKAWDTHREARDAANDWIQPPPFAGPLRVVIKFRIQRPRAHFTCHGKGKNLRYDAPTLHRTRPDLDNLAKAVLDCLQVDRARRHPERPWSNDWSISDLRVSKVYGRPGAHISIYALRGD